MNVILCSGCRADANEAALILLPSNITVFTLDFSGSGLSDGNYVTLSWHEVHSPPILFYSILFYSIVYKTIQYLLVFNFREMTSRLLFHTWEQINIYLALVYGDALWVQSLGSYLPTYFLYLISNWEPHISLFHIMQLTLCRPRPFYSWNGLG